MLCLHKRKLPVKKIYKGKTVMLDTNYLASKYIYVKFCPDCNKNIYQKKIG